EEPPRGGRAPPGPGRERRPRGAGQSPTVGSWWVVGRCPFPGRFPADGGRTGRRWAARGGPRVQAAVPAPTSPGSEAAAAHPAVRANSGPPRRGALAAEDRASGRRLGQAGPPLRPRRTLPGLEPGRQRPTQLDRFAAEVDAWIAQGGRNAAELSRKLSEQGC